MNFKDIPERGLVLLGCGKMGSALLAGWLKAGVPLPDKPAPASLPGLGWSSSGVLRLGAGGFWTMIECNHILYKT